jgi:hypothetical protein
MIILINIKKCSICNTDTKFYLKEKIFKCRNYKCRKGFSPFRGTTFSKMKLPINIQLHILYEFVKKDHVVVYVQVYKLIKIQLHDIINYFENIYEINKNSIKIIKLVEKIKL